jgi:hypothetical protein
MVKRVPVVQLVEEVSYMYLHVVYISFIYYFLYYFTTCNLYKVKVLLVMTTGVLLVEVVEVPFNSNLVWMLS